MIAVDGYDAKPMDVESVIVNTGERFDLVVSADQPKACYWIRMETLLCNKTDHGAGHADDGTHTEHEKSENMAGGALPQVAYAIIKYTNDPCTPSSKPRGCAHKNPCKILNCPFPRFPPAENRECISIGDVKRQTDGMPDEELEAVQGVHGESDSVEQIFLNLQVRGHGVATINGKQFSSPTSARTLLDVRSAGISCADNCTKQTFCQCTNIIELMHLQAYQIVITNHGYRHCK